MTCKAWYGWLPQEAISSAPSSSQKGNEPATPSIAPCHQHMHPLSSQQWAACREIGQSRGLAQLRLVFVVAICRPRAHQAFLLCVGACSCSSCCCLSTPCSALLVGLLPLPSACRSEEDKLEQYIKGISDSGAKVRQGSSAVHSHVACSLCVLKGAVRQPLAATCSS